MLSRYKKLNPKKPVTGLVSAIQGACEGGAGQL